MEFLTADLLGTPAWFWLAFAGLCGWVFSQSLSRPGDNPVSRLLHEIEYQTARLHRPGRKP